MLISALTPPQILPSQIPSPNPQRRQARRPQAQGRAAAAPDGQHEPGAREHAARLGLHGAAPQARQLMIFFCLPARLPAAHCERRARGPWCSCALRLEAALNPTGLLILLPLCCSPTLSPVHDYTQTHTCTHDKPLKRRVTIRIRLRPAACTAAAVRAPSRHRGAPHALRYTTIQGFNCPAPTRNTNLPGYSIAACVALGCQQNR